jgi:hypothetical protein
LVVLSRALILRTLTLGSADFQRDAGWRHEDVGVAYLLLRESIAGGVPLIYFALKLWTHSMKWLDMRHSSNGMITRVPDAHVLSVHRVNNALQAELAAAAFAHFERPIDADYDCVACDQWGMQLELLAPRGALPSWGYACCKRTPLYRSRNDSIELSQHLMRWRAERAPEQHHGRTGPRATRGPSTHLKSGDLEPASGLRRPL